MTDKEVIHKWKSGLSKNKLAEIYQREYNQNIKKIRSEVKNRHCGKFITSYESLAYIEKIIYKHIKQNQKL